MDFPYYKDKNETAPSLTQLTCFSSPFCITKSSVIMCKLYIGLILLAMLFMSYAL